MIVVIERHTGWGEDGTADGIIEVAIGDKFQADDDYYWFVVKEIKTDDSSA